MSSPPSAPPPLTSPTRQNPKPGQSHPTPPPPSGLAVPPGQRCRPRVSTRPCTCRAHLLDIGLSSASTRPCLSLLLGGLAGHGDGEFRRGFPKVAGRAGRPQGNGAAPPGGEGWRQEGARGAGMEPEGSRRPPPPDLPDLPLASSRGPRGRRPEGEGAGWGRLGGVFSVTHGSPPTCCNVCHPRSTPWSLSRPLADAQGVEAPEPPARTSTAAVDRTEGTPPPASAPTANECLCHSLLSAPFPTSLRVGRGFRGEPGPRAPFAETLARVRSAGRLGRGKQSYRPSGWSSVLIRQQRVSNKLSLKTSTRRTRLVVIG